MKEDQLRLVDFGYNDWDGLSNHIKRNQLPKENQLNLTEFFNIEEE